MRPPASLHALLAGAIDYAGLFPPAKLGMDAAVERYAQHRRDNASWALGRFVLPASRLDELASAHRAVPRSDESRLWRLSVLVGEDAYADYARLRAFNAAHAGVLLIDSAEVKVAAPASGVAVIQRAVAAAPPGIKLFVEIPSDGDVDSLVAAIGRDGACAKIRTGGITPEMFPPASEIVRFLRSCVRHDVAFKATAGLHHPLRARHRLTYEPDAPLGTMYGFLNVLLAAAALRNGAADDEALAILAAEERAAFSFEEAGARWGSRFVSTQRLLESHATFALSFGSCSFDEPVADLRQLALL